MPPKLPSKFSGEGNPEIVLAEPIHVPPMEPLRQGVIITAEEREVLKKVLDRDRTSKLVHGGLKSLLTLTDDDVRTLLGFLDRI